MGKTNPIKPEEIENLQQMAGSHQRKYFKNKGKIIILINYGQLMGTIILKNG